MGGGGDTYLRDELELAEKVRKSLPGRGSGM